MKKFNEIKIDEYPFTVKHLDGGEGCDGDICFVDSEGGPYRARGAINLNGRVIPLEDYIRCGTCSKVIYTWSFMQKPYSRKEEQLYHTLTRMY